MNCFNELIDAVKESHQILTSDHTFILLLLLLIEITGFLLWAATRHFRLRPSYAYELSPFPRVRRGQPLIRTNEDIEEGEEVQLRTQRP